MRMQTLGHFNFQLIQLTLELTMRNAITLSLSFHSPLSQGSYFVLCVCTPHAYSSVVLPASQERQIQACAHYIAFIIIVIIKIINVGVFTRSRRRRRHHHLPLSSTSTKREREERGWSRNQLKIWSLHKDCWIPWQDIDANTLFKHSDST